MEGFEFSDGEVLDPFDEGWDLAGYQTENELMDSIQCSSDWDVSDELDLDESLLEDQELHPSEGEQVFHGDDKKFVAHLRRVEALVRGVSKERGSHYQVIVNKAGRQELFKSLHAKELLSLVRSGCDPRCKSMAVVNQNPFVGVYHKVVEKWKYEMREAVQFGLIGKDINRTAEVLSSVINEMCAEIRRPKIIKFSKRVDRSQDLRRKKAVSLIEQCFEERSRLLVLRVDLGYRKGLFVDREDFESDLEAVKQDWARMKAAMVKGEVLPNVMRFFAKLEYGVLAGFHFHMLVMMKGAEHQQDISYARMLGDYWCEAVVGGEGRYFNCNRIKHRYKDVGIGEINYDDWDKVEALKGVVTNYIVKSDYYLGALAPSKKTFFHFSNRQKSDKPKGGRPRKYVKGA